MAGGKDESVSQPLWTPKNELLFISDRTGWWNIYREVNGKVMYLLLLLLLLLLLTPLGTGQSLCHRGCSVIRFTLDGMVLGQPSKQAGSCAVDMDSVALAWSINTRICMWRWCNEAESGEVDGAIKSKVVKWMVRW